MVDIDRTVGYLVVDLERDELVLSVNTKGEADEFRQQHLPEHRGRVIADHLTWDDAIHIAAPWETRSSLCGSWNRNLVTLDDPRPDGMSGCWTCLTASDWMDANRKVPVQA